MRSNRELDSSPLATGPGTLTWGPILLALAVSTTALSQPPEEPARVLRAGAAAVDITPTQYPINTSGLFEHRLSDRVHDPLHARALVLDSGTTAVALVIVDNLQVPADVIDAAKSNAFRQCGIAVGNMLVASTHTHSGPACSLTGPAPEVAYRKVLVDGIAEAIVRAHAALRPAAAGAAAGSMPDEVYNRRWFLKPGKMPLNPFGGVDQVKMQPIRSPEVLDRPAGPTDPELAVLSVRDAKTGKPLALVANYALHYVGGTPEGELSADYFGEFARRVHLLAGSDTDFVAMLFNGAEGDICNAPFLEKRPPRKPFEQIEIVSKKAADIAWRAQQTIAEHRPGARLAMLERRVTLKIRRPTPQQIAAAQAVLAIQDEAALAKLPRLAVNYAKNTQWMATMPETLTVPVQAIVVGDLALCGIPFEPFVEIGLELKKRSPLPHTMVIGLANGNNGYLPTPGQHKLGGYETWLGSNRVQEDASDIIIHHLIDMLAELHADAGR